MADCVRVLADWHPRRAGVAPDLAGALP
jgi:hypothetical protein